MSAVVEPVTLSSREEQARSLAAAMRHQLGPCCGRLGKADVIEIMLNAEGRVWLDRRGRAMELVGTTQNPLSKLVATAINVIAHIRKTAGSPGRRVTEIVAVTGFRDGDYQVTPMA
jgi:Flp pilus assembly CpaF family ATPase